MKNLYSQPDQFNPVKENGNIIYIDLLKLYFKNHINMVRFKSYKECLEHYKSYCNTWYSKEPVKAVNTDPQSVVVYVSFLITPMTEEVFNAYFLERRENPLANQETTEVKTGQ